MGRSKKRIKGLTPEQPITQAARLAIHQRLRAVWHYAPLAAKNADQNIEFVHQLRVASRRAHAALVVFADLLPKRKSRRMQKTLRELRRAAGTARDLDVLAERLRRTHNEKEGSQLDAVVQQVAARRRGAQKPLVVSYKRAKRKGFKRRSRALEKSVRWREELQEPSFAAAACGRLGTLVDDFFRAADADLSDVQSLHKLRIFGKQLRYAMELFANAFDKSIRADLYAVFGVVQDRLGEINDHATAITTIDEWLKQADDDHCQGKLAETIRIEQEQLERTCQAFRDWWTTERSSDLAQRFATLLQESTPSEAVPSSI